MLSAIGIYLFLHGTKNLIIIQKINSLVSIIPIFDGRKLSNKFIQGYLVDLLWYSSLLLISNSFFNKTRISYFCLLLAIILELSQYYISALGTFDFYDILIYILITIFYMLIRKKT